MKENKGKTIYRTIFVPLVVLLLVQTLLLAGSLIASGLFNRLRDNERTILEKQVENRRDSIQSVMISRYMQLTTLADAINRETIRLLADETIAIDTLDDSSTACIPLLQEVQDDILTEFRSKRVSGVYVIFNSRDLSDEYKNGASGRRPGLYIRDMDPIASPSYRNSDLLFEFAPSELVRMMNISTDNGWSTMLNYTFDERSGAYDFFYKPFQTAYDNRGAGDMEDYGYWHIAPFPNTGHPYTLSYSIPLILPNGTVYGVLGIDLTYDFLQSVFPYTELFDGTAGNYVLGFATLNKEEWARPTEIHLTSVMTNGETLYLMEGGEIILTRAEDDEYYSFTMNNTEYYANATSFSLYSNNAPFENERWILVGAVEKSRIDYFPNQIAWIVGAVIAATFVCGLALMFLFTRRVSRSISGLSEEIAEAQAAGKDILTLSETGIHEIDVFSNAITSLSHDRVESTIREQRIIEHERDYDLLTGLMNRRAFYRTAGELMKDPETMGIGALIMLDLDNLKQINDRFGHDMGDRYIYQAGSCFHEALPENALIGRLSGDEFYILLYGYNNRPEIQETIDRLTAHIEESVFDLPDRRKERVRASGGVAWYPQDARALDELMKMADFAMYQAKLDGKGKFADFDIDKFNLQSSFNESLEQLNELFRHPDLLIYHFQPIFNASDGSVFAYEALMRIALPLLSNPEEVIKLARNEKRLHEMEKLTWERAFFCYRDLIERKQVDDDAYLFINSIASEHMTTEEAAILSDTYKDIMRRLVVEITEAENMDMEATEFKRHIAGFSGAFAMDDYGSGYNSEKTLLELVPTYIKVDISIIRNIDTSRDKQMIVSNIVKYAREHRMMIIAEGLETEAEVRKAMELGVDLLQGYFLARPAFIPEELSAEARATIESFHTAEKD